MTDASRARLRPRLHELLGDGGPPPTRVVTAGFSQGAGFAIDMAVDEPRISRASHRGSGGYGASSRSVTIYAFCSCTALTTGRSVALAHAGALGREAPGSSSMVPTPCRRRSCSRWLRLRVADGDCGARWLIPNLKWDLDGDLRRSC